MYLSWFIWFVATLIVAQVHTFSWSSIPRKVSQSTVFAALEGKETRASSPRKVSFVGLKRKPKVFTNRAGSEVSRVKSSSPSETAAAPIESEKATEHETYRNQILAIANATISSRFADSVCIKRLQWVADRCEIVVSRRLEDTNTNETSIDFSRDPPPEPNAEELQNIHRSIYEQLEGIPVLDKFLANNEILVATPGIGDVLVYDRDFRSFRGFPVLVTLHEEFRKNIEYTGTLVERTLEHVRISIKGRGLSIPRELVKQVVLPPPQFEPADEEMRKLR